jgi:hypothetical protein
MAVNLGLILGSALAGAAAGGGDAAEKMGASMQDAQQKQDLVRMQAQLDEQKQMRIQEAEHNFQNQFQQNAFTQQDKTLDKTQDFTSGENQLNRESEEKRSAGNNATSLAVANISAGSAQTVEAMRAAAMKEVQQQSAKGFQIVQGADGRVCLCGQGERFDLAHSGERPTADRRKERGQCYRDGCGCAAQARPNGQRSRPEA